MATHSCVVQCLSSGVFSGLPRCVCFCVQLLRLTQEGAGEKLFDLNSSVIGEILQNSSLDTQQVDQLLDACIEKVQCSLVFACYVCVGDISAFSAPKQLCDCNGKFSSIFLTTSMII